MNYRKTNNKLIFKFNGGRGAILCSNCFAIIYEGSHIPDKYKNVIFNKQQNNFGPIFCCEECKNNWYREKHLNK